MKRIFLSAAVTAFSVMGFATAVLASGGGGGP